MSTNIFENENLIQRDSNGEFSKKIWDNIFTDLSANINSDSINYRSLHLTFVKLAQECHDNGIVFSIHAHIWGGLFPLIKFSKNQSQKNILSQILSKKLISALAYTDSKNNPTLIQSGIISGEKNFITNAPVSDYLVLYTLDSNKNMHTFITPSNAPGITYSSQLNLIGLKTSPLSHIYFNQLKTEEELELSSHNNGKIIFNSSIEKERLFIMSSILGRLIYLKNQFKAIGCERKIDGYKTYTDTLKMIDNAIDLTQVSIEFNLEKLERNENIFFSSIETKIQTTRLYQEICRQIVQALGAYGVIEENLFAKELRDSIASSIYSGSNELLENILMRCKK